MVALPTLRPTSFVQGTLINTSAVGDVSDANDATFIESASGNGVDGQWVYEITDVPADLATVDGNQVTVTVRCRLSATGDDTWRVRAFLWDSGNALVSNQPAYSTLANNTTTQQFTFTLTKTGTNNKAAWDGVRLVLDYQNVKNMAADGNVIRIADAWVTGNYTQATAPTSAPTLTLSSQGATSATLAWSSVANADSYELQRDTVTRYSGANLSFNDTGLTPGVNYTYRVRAANGGGAGPWSANLVVKIPLLATSDVTGGGQAEATGVKRAARASTVTGGGDPTATAKKDTGATAPVTGGGDVATQGREEHSITSAVSGGGSTATVGFSPQPPTNFTVVPEGEGMRLDWDANPGTFVVERERWYHDDSVPV